MSVRRRGSGRESSDGELYFEMEFPAREEDNVSFSSRSIESFGSETGPDSRQSPFREAASRESSCGPPRPSSLAIPGITALPTFSRFKRDAQYGSLPRAKTHHKVPRIQCGNFSVPTTPADSWGDKPDFLRQRDLSSSVSSVEEATEATAPATKSKSRLSLNLGVWGDSASLGPGSPVRSPRFLPRFLRSSFSKLLQGGKTRTPEPEPLPSIPYLSSILSRSLGHPAPPAPHGHSAPPVPQGLPSSSSVPRAPSALRAPSSSSSPGAQPLTSPLPGHAVWQGQQTAHGHLGGEGKAGPGSVKG